jgi:tape measure domain-containing protein
MAISTTLTIGFDSKLVQRGLTAMSSRIKNIGSSIATSLIRPFAQLTALLAPTAIVGGMVAFGKASSDAASTIENMRAQFDLFTGSAAKTETLMQSLRKIAVESPLELKDISEGARMLLTYGVEADKVSGIISQLSEVSAGSGERFQRISYAFGQISSIGRLMGTELRQLTEAGFNPLESISKKTGETMIQLKKRMEDGGVSIAEVQESLKAATSEGGRFAGMNAKMSQTFSGRVSMMKDQWFSFTAAFGDGMNQGLKTAADAVTAGLPIFQERFRKMGSLLGNAISDSVNGNHDKFIAIGELIGNIIGAAATAAFQAASSSMVTGTENLLRSLLDKEMNLIHGSGQSGKGLAAPIGGPSFGELLEAQLINRGVRQQSQSVSQGTQGIVPGSGGRFQFAPPGSNSPLSDANGNRVVEVLGKIEKNTAQGAKM